MATIQYLTTNEPLVDDEGYITVSFKRWADLMQTRSGGVRGGSYLQLADEASVIWDVEQKPAAFVVLGGNRAVADPVNMTPGLTYKLTVIQDASGSRTLTWGGSYKFPGGTPPTLSTAGNAVDELTFNSDGSNMKLVGFAKDLR